MYDPWCNLPPSSRHTRPRWRLNFPTGHSRRNSRTEHLSSFAAPGTELRQQGTKLSFSSSTRSTARRQALSAMLSQAFNRTGPLPRKRSGEDLSVLLQICAGISMSAQMISLNSSSSFLPSDLHHIQERNDVHGSDALICLFFFHCSFCLTQKSSLMSLEHVECRENGASNDYLGRMPFKKYGCRLGAAVDLRFQVLPLILRHLPSMTSSKP